MERCESDTIVVADFFFFSNSILTHAFANQGFIVGTIAGTCRFYDQSGILRSFFSLM
jgi:hypothetical protein